MTIESTNALVAALRALDSEMRRLECRLAGDDLDDETSEELGLYVTDLQEAAAALGEEYEQRRGADGNLTALGTLLAHFEREDRGGG
jgi:hypothetical protein